MEIYIPQTIDEWMPLAVPIAAFLIGLAFFVAPRLVLNAIDLKDNTVNFLRVVLRDVTAAILSYDGSINRGGADLIHTHSDLFVKCY